MKLFNAKSYIANLVVSVSLCLIAATVIYVLMQSILIHNLENSLKEIAKQGAVIVAKEVDRYLNILETLAIMDQIKDPENSIDNKLKILKAEVFRSKHDRMTLIDPQGWGRTTDGNRLYLKDRVYYQKALTGRSNVSDPLIARTDGKKVVIFAVPVFYHRKVVAVLTATHEVSILSKITDNIKLGKYGSAFMLNSRGDTIAHRDRRLVYTQDNDFENVKKDPTLKTLVQLEWMMVRRKTGAGEYTYHGLKKYMAFAPVKGTNWSLAVTAPKNQVFANLNQVFFFLGLLTFSFSLLGVVMNTYNIYLRRRLNKAITTSNNAIDTANITIIGFDLLGIIRGFNQYAEIKLGYPKNEIIGIKNIADFVADTHRSEYLELLEHIKGEKTIHNFELPFQRYDGSAAYFIWNVNLIKDEFDGIDIVEIMGIDISDRVKSEHELLANHEELTALYEQLASSNEELRYQYLQLNSTQEMLSFSEERYRLAQEGSNDVIWDWEDRNNTIYFSNKISFLLGYTAEEIASPNSFKEIIHPDDIEESLHSVRSHFQGATHEIAIELRLKAKDGLYKWVFVRGKAIKNKSGMLVRIAGSLTDISDRKAKEQHIHQLAYYDSLTGLPNRTWLYENIAVVIEDAKADRKKGALIFIDIDNFKLINDTFGHFLGDRILCLISERLKEAAGPKNIVSRLSGDEFVVIIDAQTGEESITRFADEIINSFGTPYQMDGNNFFITASAGIAVFPNCGDTFEELLKNADLAMYHAKGEGKRHYVYYETSMKESLLEKTRFENSLRQAFHNNELSLAFQPLVSVTSGNITGYEALLRWNSTEFGEVFPAKFIKIAEETGLIVPVGLWVLKNAVEFALKIIQKDPSLYVSVNISVIQLMQNDFVENIAKIITEYEFPTQNLNLEITESLLMESMDENIGKLERLKELGFGISLDDFGTGYSSLNYLKQLPIDTVKIDKSFIKDIPSNDIEKNLTVSIISLAHMLGLKVVAEGVETIGQYEFLSRHHCDLIQGYLVSPPLTAAEAFRFRENRDKSETRRQTETGPDTD